MTMGRLSIMAAILLSSGSVARCAQTPAFVAAGIAAPDRPKADRDRDMDRKPAALLAFAGIRPGERIADIMPGQGYFTRIFSHAVGPAGHVYALVPSELAQVAPQIAESAKALATDPVYGNVTVLIAPTASLAAPEPLDMAWTSDNYHDLYAFFGADAALAFDTAIFRMLKPGGSLMVIDHAASGDALPRIRQLHRIDPQVVKSQVMAAGFVFEGESPVLRNPFDLRNQPVFAPSIRGRTDQFVLKFRKPL